MLTDNGTQYVTWRGKSPFTRELEKRGIRQIVARPRRPQTLGKIERFWGTLWRECVETAVFVDLADARPRIGLFIDHYNFQRPHQGIDGLVPADRFFGAAPEVLKTLKARVAANALELARHGVPKTPFYLTGQVGGQPFSVHAEGERVILRQAGQDRQEIDLVPPAEPPVEPTQPSSAAENGAAAENVAVHEALPQPLCPDGSPQTAWQPPDAELPPGVSGLDEPRRPTASLMRVSLVRARKEVPYDPCYATATERDVGCPFVRRDALVFCKPCHQGASQAQGFPQRARRQQPRPIARRS